MFVDLALTDAEVSEQVLVLVLALVLVLVLVLALALVPPAQPARVRP